jgi:hypothetical protein
LWWRRQRRGSNSIKMIQCYANSIRTTTITPFVGLLKRAERVRGRPLLQQPAASGATREERERHKSVRRWRRR